MHLEVLYELQFASCLLKDLDSFDLNSADWQPVCYSLCESELLDFIETLEVVDNFRSDLSDTSFSSDFRVVYKYRVVQSSGKILFFEK